jgi:hypothetical protein
MKRKIQAALVVGAVVALFILLAPFPVSAFDVAPLQFPVLIPLNGYVSETGFPIAIRNLDVNVFPYLGVSSTLLIYNIQGLGVSGLPTDEPIVGPTYTLLGNLCLKLMLPAGSFLFTAKGGGFSFFNLSPFLMEGNLEEAIARDRGWDKASVDAEFENSLGFGWVVGGSITYYLIEELAGIFIEVLYYRGEAPLKLSGKVTGVDGGAVVADDESFSYPDVKIDFTAIEVTLGVTITI